MEPEYIASMSGGKDSTAMALHLMERGIEFDPVFFDTGWEHAAVYEYVENDLPRVLGKPVRAIVGPLPELSAELEDIARAFEARIGRKSGMVRWCLNWTQFPTGRMRWCTQKLKLDAFKSVRAEYDLPVSCVGVRAAESEARSKLPERELSTSLDCMVWRPILSWTKADVIAIHNRHGIAPNGCICKGLAALAVGPVSSPQRPKSAF